MKLFKYVRPGGFEEGRDALDEGELSDIMERMGAQVIIQYNNIKDLKPKEIFTFKHSNMEH